MNEYIVGIDIGSSSVCAAAGKIDKHSEIQIMGITSSNCIGVKRGIVVDIDNTSESIKRCISSLERMVDTKITEAYIALPGGISELVWNKGVVAVSSEDREIKENDVKRVLKASKIINIPNDKEIIGVIPQQYIIDGYDKIKDPIGMCGLRLEVDSQIILAQSTVVNNIFKSVNKAGIKVLGVVFEPIAVSGVVLKEEEIQRGIALVDAGSDSINIYIYKGGSLKSISTLPLGGDIITNDIAVCLKIPILEAEKLKIKYGSVAENSFDDNFKVEVNANYNNKVKVDCNILNQIIEARVEELFSLINRELSKSEYYDELSGIVIVGGGMALINGIEEFGKDVLGKLVRVGIPKYIGAASPLYVTAVGIVKDVSNSIKLKNIPGVNPSKNNNLPDYKNIIEDENEKEMESENKTNGFISRIKDFFTDFF
ncbi:MULTISPECIES: cell division protein FtsA [Clostridium]|uniref:Cell division protein FtsA n=1 Tax=Clostridium lapidicellarium TaxID=3240931 RepID=A0ABV4DSI4_9CLOT|nr:cell division protein FtsA [uncultured Clostridium sp.]NLU07467.1 cell division protein FtsA [Clostridiales bacterium]